MSGKNLVRHLSKGSFLTAALSFSLVSPFAYPALAAISITDSDVVNAIEKAKILAPTIRLNAKVGADEVIIATYKNPKAADKDCKIEAVFIAKTVMDLAPGEVPRVTVYFYSSTSLSNYKEVTVTAGDVKAFASGSLSQDELMASVKVTEGTISDPKRRLEEYMSEAGSRRRNKITTVIKGDDVMVTTGRDTGLTERNLKFEAMKMAEQAFEAAPAEAKNVVVTFEDLAEHRQNEVITFGRKELQSLEEVIGGALKDVKVEVVKVEKGGSGSSTAPVAGGKIDLEKVAIKDGPLKAERENLLERLKGLTKAGVGFGTKPTDDLMEIEAKVDSDTEEALKEKISKLSELIGKFEENLKGAKEHKAVGPSKAAGSGAGAGASAAAGGALKGGSSGNIDDMKRMVLSNPDAYINSMAASLVVISPVTGKAVGRFKSADEHPTFRRNLQFAIDTLKGAGRNAEAEKFQARLDQIKAKYGQ
ncbi:MAG: hypothetical protein JST01_16660 [Cyanobacteria bacterium SZAS TMP-1]|nr:hypothetical protein [Cyanobacteria bacterium SZAS TMP-1]